MRPVEEPNPAVHRINSKRIRMSAVTRALVKPLAVASLSLATLLPVLAGAQAVQLAPESPVAVVGGRAPVPYRVGEGLTYKATFGVIPAGTARMRVDGVE